MKPLKTAFLITLVAFLISIITANNSYSLELNETYEALAWVGLRGEGGINGVTGLTENPTAAWENLDQERRLELIDLNDMFKENNPNCQ